MLISICVPEERFEEIKRELPLAVATNHEDRDGWVWATLEIETSADALHLFHAGINFGMKVIANRLKS